MGLFAKEKEAPKNYNVIVTTTNEIVGHEIKEYLGIISGRAFITEVIATPKKILKLKLKQLGLTQS